MKRITITLRPCDIRRGKRSDYTQCPIALAGQRQIPSFSVQAFHHHLVIYRHDPVESKVAGFPCYSRRQYDLPKAAVTFIKRFDAGKRVEPFSFDLEVDE